MTEWEILRKRLLRSFSRMARQPHDCWHCCKLIEPGEEYECEVYAMRVRNLGGPIEDKLQTWKKHRYCEPPPEESDESEADISLPLAA